jgi:hypothetical protein
MMSMVAGNRISQLPGAETRTVGSPSLNSICALVHFAAYGDAIEHVYNNAIGHPHRTQ